MVLSPEIFGLSDPAQGLFTLAGNAGNRVKGEGRNADGASKQGVSNPEGGRKELRVEPIDDLQAGDVGIVLDVVRHQRQVVNQGNRGVEQVQIRAAEAAIQLRSEEHTSELQSL